MKTLYSKLTLLAFVITALTIGKVRAQDADKNEKLYALIKLSYINNSRIIMKYSPSGQTGTAVELDASQAYVASLNFAIGYYLLPKKLAVGLGMGLDGYNKPYFNTAPLYLDVWYFIRRQRNSPFVFGSYGAYIQYMEAFDKGIYMRVGAGYKGFVTRKLNMLMAVSYAPAAISLTNQSYLTSDNKVWVNGISFTIGFVLF